MGAFEEGEEDGDRVSKGRVEGVSSQRGPRPFRCDPLFLMTRGSPQIKLVAMLVPIGSVTVTIVVMSVAIVAPVVEPAVAIVIVTTFVSLVALMPEPGIGASAWDKCQSEYRPDGQRK